MLCFKSGLCPTTFSNIVSAQRFITAASLNRHKNPSCIGTNHLGCNNAQFPNRSTKISASKFCNSNAIDFLEQKDNNRIVQIVYFSILFRLKSCFEPINTTPRPQLVEVGVRKLIICNIKTADNIWPTILQCFQQYFQEFVLIFEQNFEGGRDSSSMVSPIAPP